MLIYSIDNEPFLAALKIASYCLPVPGISKSVLDVVANKNDNLWIATSQNELFVYNSTDKIIQNINIKKFFPEGQYFKNRVVHLFVDSDNFIWLITEYGTLIKCEYSNENLQQKMVFLLPTSIFCMTEDNNGTMIVAGFN